MKIYLSTWSVHRLFFDGLVEVSQMPGLAKSLGFDGVELEDIWFPSSGEKYVRTLKRQLSESNSSVLMAVSNDFSVDGRKDFLRQVSHVRKYLRIAQRLGSNTVRVLMGAHSAKKSILPQIIQGFRIIAGDARKLNLRLAVENHDRLSCNAETLLSVLSEFDKKWFGVCLDLGNLNPRSRYDSIEKLAPRTFMVHAKTYAFINGEESTINYRRCLRILRSAGFKGPIVVEYDGSGDQLIGSLATRTLVKRYARIS